MELVDLVLTVYLVEYITYISYSEIIKFVELSLVGFLIGQEVMRFEATCKSGISFNSSRNSS